MIPSLAIVWIGRGRRLPIPVLLCLLWPLVLVGLFGTVVAGRIAGDRTDAGRRLVAARLGLVVLLRLSGLAVDARSSDGSGVRLRLL